MSDVKESKQQAAGRGSRREDTRKKTVVYIGPTIKNVAATGTIYNNGIPEKLAGEITRQPIIGSLLVPVEELAAAQRELAVQGSALKVIYNKVITK